VCVCVYIYRREHVKEHEKRVKVVSTKPLHDANVTRARGGRTDVVPLPGDRFVVGVAHDIPRPSVRVRRRRRTTAVQPLSRIVVRPSAPVHRTERCPISNGARSPRRTRRRRRDCRCEGLKYVHLSILRTQRSRDVICDTRVYS